MKADILAFEAEGIISKLVGLVTKSKITHIGILKDEHFFIESVITGVKFTEITYVNRNYHILRNPELNDIQRQDIIKFVINKINYKYDFKLFIGIGLKKIFGINTKWNDTNKYICSELIYEAYKSVGIDLIPCAKPEDMTPGNIYNSSMLVEVHDL